MTGSSGVTSLSPLLLSPNHGETMAKKTKPAPAPKGAKGGKKSKGY
jgi:hypothetical protein